MLSLPLQSYFMRKLRSFAIARPTRELMLASVLLCLPVIVLSALASAQKKHSGTKNSERPEEVLRHYLWLRLKNADWKEYSKFITWPDEPSWDCYHITSRLEFGAPKTSGKTVHIAVVFHRLGLYCINPDFTPDPKAVTITYELIERRGVWLVNSPSPDYPDISVDSALASLNSASPSTDQPVEICSKAQTVARQIAALAKYHH